MEKTAELPQPLRGIVPPMVTPLKDRNTLDGAGIERLVEHVLSGGVHGYEDVVKCLMSGAQVAMMTSALYKYGLPHIRRTLTDLESWMAEKGHDSISDMRGRLCVYTTGNQAAFERANYMRVLKSF